MAGEMEKGGSSTNSEERRGKEDGGIYKSNTNGDAI